MTLIKGERKRRVRFTASTLRVEEKEWLLTALACNLAYFELQQEFRELFDRDAPRPNTISGYKARHAEEIAARRARFVENIRGSGLPYVLQCDRIQRYGRFVRLETKRKRYTDAAKHLRAIAEEVGDLKQNVDFNDVTKRPDSELLAIVEAAVEQTDAAGEKGGGGTGEPLRDQA